MLEGTASLGQTRQATVSLRNALDTDNSPAVVSRLQLVYSVSPFPSPWDVISCACSGGSSGSSDLKVVVASLRTGAHYVRLDSKNLHQQETKALNQTPSAMMPMPQLRRGGGAPCACVFKCDKEKTKLLSQRVTSRTRLTSATVGPAKSSRTGIRSSSSLS